MIKSKTQIIRFDAVNSVEIDRSIDRIISSAKFKIPLSARLEYKDKKSTTDQTSNVFNKGDKINIKLGYDNRLYEEFEGFISKTNYTKPLEIECQGYEYLLNDNIPTKTFKTTNLKEVLNYIIKDVDITLDGNIPMVNMQNYVIPANLKKIDALQQLKEKYGLTIYFLKNVLFAGLDYQKYLGTVKYSLGINTPRVDELKYQTADEVKLKVKAIQINKDNIGTISCNYLPFGQKKYACSGLRGNFECFFCRQHCRVVCGKFCKKRCVFHRFDDIKMVIRCTSVCTETEWYIKPVFYEVIGEYPAYGEF